MKRLAKEFFPYIIILAVVLCIKFFVVTPIRVNGPSMEPTLKNGDIMILNEIGKYFRKYERFDIVVIHAKVYDKNEDIIKRIIGLPGDSIFYKDDILYVNGEKVDEPFSREKTKDFDMDLFNVSTIPDGYYLVLGDNRVNSTDSRILGLIKEKDMMGTTSLVLFPFNRFGFKK